MAGVYKAELSKTQAGSLHWSGFFYVGRSRTDSLGEHHFCACPGLMHDQWLGYSSTPRTDMALTSQQHFRKLFTPVS